MSHKITLSWTAPASSDPVQSYNVKRAAHGTTNFVAIGTPILTTFVDTNVVPGDKWDYEVTSVNASGESVPCPVVAADAVPFSVPGAPTGLVAVTV